MPIASTLIFFASFIFVFLLGLYMFLIFYNKRTHSVRERFLKHTNGLGPTVFKNIKLRYWTTNGLHGLNIQVYPNNRCDLYLFDNCLAIVRKQDFILKVFFAPILLTSDIAATKKMFDYLNTYKPTRVNFNQFVKGQVEIKLTDPIYKNYKIDITLKGLSNDQINLLEKNKNWC